MVIPALIARFFRHGATSHRLAARIELPPVLFIAL
jgi:hypothetical protein